MKVRFIEFTATDRDIELNKDSYPVFEWDGASSLSLNAVNPIGNVVVTEKIFRRVRIVAGGFEHIFYICFEDIHFVMPIIDALVNDRLRNYHTIQEKNWQLNRDNEKLMEQIDDLENRLKPKWYKKLFKYIRLSD